MPALQCLLVAQSLDPCLLGKEAHDKDGAVEALEKALTFTIDAYSESGLVGDDQIIKKLQDTLLHFKRKTISASGVNNGIEAYVMLNCDLGLEDTIIRELVTMSEVSEVKGVFGVYDIIVKIDTDSEDDVRRVIERIRSMPQIKSSLTMMVIEDQGSQIIGR